MIQAIRGIEKTAQKCNLSRETLFKRVVQSQKDLLIKSNIKVYPKQVGSQIDLMEGFAGVDSTPIYEPWVVVKTMQKFELLNPSTWFAKTDKRAL